MEKYEPIKKILVSAAITGNAEVDEKNSKAITALFHKGFTLNRSNGEATFGLTDLEEKVVKAGDAFVFLPIPKEIKQLSAPQKRTLFREMFKAASLFVGAQTKDPNLRLDPEDEASPLKPIILVNQDKCWDSFKKLLDHMHELGTITQDPSNILHMADNIHDAMQHLERAHEQKIKKAVRHPSPYHYTKADIAKRQHDPQETRKPPFNVCVFCSASTKNPELISVARQLGANIASQNWGLISGIGSTGMMGAVVEGAAEVVKNQHKGWIAGSNLPRIINMEGMPEYFDRFWSTEDIYNRMDVMIENSQAFVVMPGGMGTVQELMALLLLKHAKDDGKPYRMADKQFGNKPIILVNHEFRGKEHKGKIFWQPVVELAEKFGFRDDILVVNDIQEAMRELQMRCRNHADRVLRRG